jgi:quaternary ammonium compound-resistance protein SugE
MAWLLLLLASVFEIGWAVGLKYTEGFARPLPTFLTVASMVASVALLGLSLKALPLGTAYAIWTGIGTLGTAVLGIILFGESAGATRLTCIGLIVAGIAGLKLVSPD